MIQCFLEPLILARRPATSISTSLVIFSMFVFNSSVVKLSKATFFLAVSVCKRLYNDKFYLDDLEGINTLIIKIAYVFAWS